MTPETPREAPWDFAPFTEPELRDVERRAREQLAYHDKRETVPRCSRCCELAEVLRLVATVRAALERPSPAPPERDRIELMAARAGSHDASWCSVHDAPRSRFECVNCFDELAAFALGGGSAGTGAAPPDVCNCWDKAPTIPTCRGPNTHLDDCPAKDSGLPVGVNWQREMARRLGTPSRKPCYSCATGHLDLLEIPVCDTCGNFLVSGRIAKVLDRVRGGAAQPPPSALEIRNDNLRSELEGVYRDYDFLRAEFDEYKRTHPGVPREETNHE